MLSLWVNDKIQGIFLPHFFIEHYQAGDTVCVITEVIAMVLWSLTFENFWIPNLCWFSSICFRISIIQGQWRARNITIRYFNNFCEIRRQHYFNSIQRFSKVSSQPGQVSENLAETCFTILWGHSGTMEKFKSNPFMASM